jgi:hypothetical protein
MLRASYATGHQPPPFGDLIDAAELTTTVPLAVDSKRGGTSLGAAGPYSILGGGNPALKAVRARTVFMGAVLSPLGEDGPRLAIDFSRIRRTDDVLFPSVQLLMEHEDSWPQLVTRAPLTAADRALGYTAGPVILVDIRGMNSGALEVDSVDERADWLLPLLKGRLRLYANATDHMSNRATGLFQPAEQTAGSLNGPLKWRANGGFDWTRYPLTIGANVQYFGSSSVFQEGVFAGVNHLNERAQGSAYIPSQTYLDLHVGWRLAVPAWGHSGDLAIDFGIINALDRSPPRVSSLITAQTIDVAPAYSLYGDPRQRRFELALSGHF